MKKILTLLFLFSFVFTAFSSTVDNKEVKKEQLEIVQSDCQVLVFQVIHYSVDIDVPPVDDLDQLKTNNFAYLVNNDFKADWKFKLIEIKRNFKLRSLKAKDFILTLNKPPNQYRQRINS